MVDKGNRDGHRQTYSGGIKAVEESKWGRATAAERYGKPQSPNMRPKDMSFPQAKEDQRGPDWADDTANDWRRGNGMRPGFNDSQGYSSRKK